MSVGNKPLHGVGASVIDLIPLDYACVAGVNWFFRWRQSFLPVLSLHHWSTIAQSDAKGVRSSVSEFC